MKGTEKAPSDERDLSPDVVSELIYSFMVVPFPLMQLVFEKLSSLSQNQINNCWRSALVNPPLVDIPNHDPPFELPFELDEDCAILTHLRLNGGQFDISKLLSLFDGYINTSRTASSLESRARFLSELTTEQRDAIFERMAQKITMEEVFGMSVDGNEEELLDYRLTRHDILPCRSERVFDEMDELLKTVPIPAEKNDLSFLAGMVFEHHRHCLAAFHAQTHIYYMQRQGVVLGCGLNCDIDLTKSLTRPDAFMSERQARVSLQEDLSFILENIGKNEILVNGTPILTNQACTLPKNCMIELPGGTVVLFLCNLDLLDRIANPDDQGDFPIG